VLRTPYALSPLSRGEGKKECRPLFSLLPAKWGEGAPEGRMRGIAIALIPSPDEPS
jgi:hypothetical protein